MGSTTLKVGAKDDTRVSTVMPSFAPQMPVSNAIGTEGGTTHSSRISDFGTFEQSLGYRVAQAANTSRNILSQQTNSSNSVGGLHFGSFNKSLASFNTNLSAAIVGPQTLQLQNGQQPNLVSVPGSHRENGGESNMEDGSPLTDSSTDGDTDEKNQMFEMARSNAIVASDSSERSKEKQLDQKTLRRLAQNREAARKSRLRKKAYVQQLESSRLKLTQLEQELQRARQQGIFISSSGDQSQATGGNGALAFDVEYTRWLEEHNRQINELRTAVNSHASDTELRTMVESAITHFDDVFRLKGNAAKVDVFHILSGMWKTPAERCFLWIGGFRSSELLKLLMNQLEPLTEQQLVGIYSLQQSSQQAEDALSQGMEALQQSLAETLANGSPGPSGPSGNAGPSGNVANYMGQMAMAMGKLGTLGNFVRQADNLRQQTLQQMHRILTTRQSARALLAINDYFSRLRALSSLWLARPQE
ncbi:TGACG-sequence-specific DNA-binding protein like [Actinidia chinensis var. chinensis]|uniref:TGACG-sequence-specific DNA-binding protein like n=1 Tax=Actinidia chinensis var. chinensis TaxID=1590841 RepID=A0A2R6RY96_ACTCC|nr:TGACG-sequence-specific DNA-binding protein like [Actinidia chinensis var. chinensis]